MSIRRPPLTRAGEVIGRIRDLFKKERVTKDGIDMNEVIHDVTGFLRDEATSQRVHIQTNLAPALPKTTGDRVQLQQVVINLIVNAMDAMAKITDRPKGISITSHTNDSREIVIEVKDCGWG